MTTRAERIKRRNAKKEKAFFIKQKLLGAAGILSGCVAFGSDPEMNFFAVVFIAVGGWFVLTGEKVMEDNTVYEKEM